MCHSNVAGGCKVTAMTILDVVINARSHSEGTFFKTGTQQTFSCSKSTIETLGKGVKHVQS